jgi:hypothetical protein
MTVAWDQTEAVAPPFVSLSLPLFSLEKVSLLARDSSLLVFLLLFLFTSFFLLLFTSFFLFLFTSFFLFLFLFTSFPLFRYSRRTNAKGLGWYPLWSSCDDVIL